MKDMSLKIFHTQDFAEHIPIMCFLTLSFVLYFLHTNSGCTSLITFKFNYFLARIKHKNMCFISLLSFTNRHTSSIVSFFIMLKRLTNRSTCCQADLSTGKCGITFKGIYNLPRNTLAQLKTDQSIFIQKLHVP
jgi:hypothetical protein